MSTRRGIFWADYGILKCNKRFKVMRNCNLINKGTEIKKFTTEKINKNQWILIACRIKMKIFSVAYRIYWRNCLLFPSPVSSYTIFLFFLFSLDTLAFFQFLNSLNSLPGPLHVVSSTWNDLSILFALPIPTVFSGQPPLILSSRLRASCYMKSYYLVFSLQSTCLTVINHNYN